jgi:hypothetical protein
MALVGLKETSVTPIVNVEGGGGVSGCETGVAPSAGGVVAAGFAATFGREDGITTTV